MFIPIMTLHSYACILSTWTQPHQLIAIYIYLFYKWISMHMFYLHAHSHRYELVCLYLYKLISYINAQNINFLKWNVGKPVCSSYIIVSSV